MHRLSTHTKRSHALLLAAVVLVALSFAFRATLALSANHRHTTNASSALKAGLSHPVAPAGLQGPIRLTCGPGHTAVIGSDAPAGPQGHVGVSCASGPTKAK